MNQKVIFFLENEQIMPSSKWSTPYLLHSQSTSIQPYNLSSHVWLILFRANLVLGIRLALKLALIVLLRAGVEQCRAARQAKTARPALQQINGSAQHRFAHGENWLSSSRGRHDLSRRLFASMGRKNSAWIWGTCTIILYTHFLDRLMCAYFIY